MKGFKAAAAATAALATLGAGTAALAASDGGRSAGACRGLQCDEAGVRGQRGDDDRRQRQRGRVLATTLRDADGDRVGRVGMVQQGRRGDVLVSVRVRNLPPGFHGFHIHETGACVRPTFTSAGGHYSPDDATHRDHAGDLPTLLVNEDGTGVLATITDRFTLRELRRGDGSAVMVHELPDNYANIPDRYGEPDEETLSTGDAGSRLACAEIEPRRR